jgi:hypothetical protein
VDPKALSVDYEAAFWYLRKNHPDSTIYAIVDGISYDHIVNVKTMPQKTLVMFTMQAYGAPVMKVFKVEEIEEFGIRNTIKKAVRINFPSSTNAP